MERDGGSSASWWGTRWARAQMPMSRSVGFAKDLVLGKQLADTNPSNQLGSKLDPAREDSSCLRFALGLAMFDSGTADVAANVEDELSVA